MRNRHSLLVIFLLALFLGMPAVGLEAAVSVQCPADVDGIDTDQDGIVDNDNVCLHLTAGDGYIKMANGRDLYMFGFSDVTGMPEHMVMMAGMMGGEFPAPTIKLREGQQVYLTLTNVGMLVRPDLFDPHTVHFHGFPNAAPIFDGMPDGSIAINMGSSLTYFYNLAEPGTYMYHCHVEATEHMQMGMLGNLYVEAIQNMLPDGTDLNGFTHQAGFKYAYNDGDGSTYYDQDYILQLSSMDPAFHDASETVQPLPFALMKDTFAMFNGRGYPDTIKETDIVNMHGRASQKVSSLMTANQGEKVLLRLSSLSISEFFTVSVLGIPATVVGKGARLLRGPDPDGAGPLLGKNLYYRTNSVDLGGGEAFDLILDTTDVAPGTYFIYTTNLNYLSNDTEDLGGMMTEIIIY